MVTARLRVELPDAVWVGEVSRAHPEATFRLVAGLPDGEERAVEVGQVAAPNLTSVAATVRAHPAIETFDSIVAVEGRSLARYRTSDLLLYEVASVAGSPPLFPVEVRVGTATVDLSTYRTGVREAVAWLRDRGVGVAVDALTEGDDGAGAGAGAGATLTARQREVAAVALRAGYYDVPRTATLADVAAELGVAASTASRTLRRAERRVLEATVE
jgi:hypothetical protein